MRDKHFARACSVATTTLALLYASSVFAQAPVNSVTGSGFVGSPHLPEFRTTVAAFKDADGNVSGVTGGQVDLRPFGLGHLSVHGDVTCVLVEGNSAWIGATITHSNKLDLTGLTVISLVRDLGGNGEDIMHSEIFPPDFDCNTKPPLPETVVSSGNFKVR